MTRRYVLALVITALAAAILPPVTVLGATQGASCGTDNEWVNLHENQIGDTSDGDDRLYRCGTGDSSLKNVPHTLPGRCKSAGVKIDDEWNACVSAFYAAIPSGRKFCLYAAADYIGKIQCYSPSFTR